MFDIFSAWNNFFSSSAEQGCLFEARNWQYCLDQWQVSDLVNSLLETGTLHPWISNVPQGSVIPQSFRNRNLYLSYSEDYLSLKPESTSLTDSSTALSLSLSKMVPPPGPLAKHCLEKDYKLSHYPQWLVQFQSYLDIISLLNLPATEDCCNSH